MACAEALVEHGMPGAQRDSSLLRVAEYTDHLHEVVDLLLKAGADPNRTVTKRWDASADASPQEIQNIRIAFSLPASEGGSPRT